MPRRYLATFVALTLALIAAFLAVPAGNAQADAEAPIAAIDLSEVPSGAVALPQLALKLRAGANAQTLAALFEAISSERIHGLDGWYLLRFTDVATMNAQVGEIIAHADVAAYARQYQSPSVNKTNDPLFANQYHLKNTGQLAGQAGTDINAEAAWLAGYTGTGVTVGVIDDGIEIAHEDLAPNVDTALSHDFRSNDSDPSPVTVDDDHGTSVAGLIAAKGENSIGVSGGAYNAKLAGLRLVGTGQSFALEASALGYKRDEISIYSNSWGPSDDGNYHPISSMPRDAIRAGVSAGRNGRGSIFVWAGGNGGFGDWSNFDGYANMPETIAVGSMTRFGTLATYSERGSNILCVAPGGSSDVYTTDRSGASGYNNGSLIADPNYTNNFDGTSAATPMVASVIALMLEANPNLTWRDVQHILARTSRKVMPQDSGWKDNSAGFHHHHGFGFGLVDADAATNAARQWKPIGARRSVDSVIDVANAPIPDNDPNGVTRTITFPTPIFVEHVVLDVQLTHPAWGDLIISLTSPQGTVSQLSARTFGSSPSGLRYEFMTLRNWGEAANGTWALRIVDDAFTDHGDIATWKITVYGTDEQVSSTGGVPPVVNTINTTSFMTGESLTINGAFLTGASVTIGGIDATVLSSSSLQLVVRVSPLTPLGMQTLIVKTLSGEVTETVTVLPGGPTASLDGGGSGGGCALQGFGDDFLWLIAFIFATMALTVRRRRSTEIERKAQ